EREVAGSLAPAEAPLVRFVGCETVAEGPVCALRPGAALTLWIAVPPAARLTLALDDRPVDATWVVAEDGLRTVVTPDARDGAVTVRDAELGWRWSLTLRPAPPRAPEVAELDALARSGREVEAEAALAELLPTLRGGARVD